MTEFDGAHIPHGTRFFVAWPKSQNGKIDTRSETIEAYPSLEEVTEAMKEDVEDNGGTMVIYECSPVRQVERGAVRVRAVKLREPKG